MNNLEFQPLLTDKDPFYVEIHGKKKRRKAPDTCTKEEQKAWKRIKKKAWLDDKNFFGCYPINLGLGLAPLLSLIPVIGPLLMFAIHGRLVTIADQEFKLPVTLVTKMNGNIAFDLLISLPPIIGSLFSWLNGCSTRNAALLHTHLVKREDAKERERLQQMNVQTAPNRPENLSGAHAFQARQQKNEQGRRGKGPQRQQQHQKRNSQASSSSQTAGTYQVSQPSSTNKYIPAAQQQTSPAGGTTVPIRKPPPAAYNEGQTQTRGRQY